MSRCAIRISLAAALTIGLGGASFSQELQASGPQPEKASAPPNVVYVLLDDAHYDDFGAYGNEFIRTPAIDALAKDGLRFTQYYVNGPVCSPTRAGLLTGRYPHEFNLGWVVRYVGYPDAEGRRNAASGRGIPGRVTTLGDLLSGQGYATAQMAKGHVGQRRSAYQPTGQGFDQSILSPAGPTSVHRDVALQIDGERREQTEGFLTDVITDRALDFIRDHADRPFFLNLWFVSSHKPLEPPPRWVKEYPDTSLSRCAAMVSHVDEQVGRLTTKLKSLGILLRTLFIVASDEGGDPEVHPASALRAFKWSLYEGRIRAPMIAHWPDRVGAGVTDQWVGEVRGLWESAEQRAPLRFTEQAR